MKKTAPLWILALLGSCGFVYHISYRVEALEKQLNTVKAEIAQSREEEGVLKAEWAYLTEPSRLESLAQRYLATMTPAKSAQLQRAPSGTQVASAPALFAAPVSRVADAGTGHHGASAFSFSGYAQARLGSALEELR